MFYTEKERQIEIAGEYDVIVAGSGPSGMAAAVAAARNGAKVLILEALGAVGGIATSGLMSHFTSPWSFAPCGASSKEIVIASFTASPSAA